MEFEINMSEMPLGKLSKRNIDQGLFILNKITHVFFPCIELYVRKKLDC